MSQIGVSYPQVGEELATRWKFPKEISRAIGEQIDPLAIDDFSVLACLLNTAKYLVDSNRKQLSEEDIIAGFPTEIARAAGLEPSQLFDELDATVALGSEFDQILH